jgi:hypothetical protein
MRAQTASQILKLEYPDAASKIEPIAVSRSIQLPIHSNLHCAGCGAATEILVFCVAGGAFLLQAPRGGAEAVARALLTQSPSWTTNQVRCQSQAAVGLLDTIHSRPHQSPTRPPRHPPRPGAACRTLTHTKCTLYFGTCPYAPAQPAGDALSSLHPPPTILLPPLSHSQAVLPPPAFESHSRSVSEARLVRVRSSSSAYEHGEPQIYKGGRQTRMRCDGS